MGLHCLASFNKDTGFYMDLCLSGSLGNYDLIGIVNRICSSFLLRLISNPWPHIIHPVSAYPILELLAPLSNTYPYRNSFLTFWMVLNFTSLIFSIISFATATLEEAGILNYIVITVSVTRKWHLWAFKISFYPIISTYYYFLFISLHS